MMKKLLLILTGMLASIIAMAQPGNAIINNSSADVTTLQITLPEYKGHCKCGNPLSSVEFNFLLADIKAKGTDTKMLRFAKHKIRDKCLFASQVEEITLLFMFDINRSAFVGFARKYTYDLINYYALRLKYPKEPDTYQIPNGKNIHSLVNTHNELHDNWGQTNKSNAVFVNWMYHSYGTGTNGEINR